jgi:hypothetical protein
MLITKQAIKLENTEILYLIASFGTEHSTVLAFKRISYNLRACGLNRETGLSYVIRPVYIMPACLATDNWRVTAPLQTTHLSDAR